MEDTRLRELESRVFSLEAANAVQRLHNSNVEKSLASIHDNLKWLIRLVFGGIIMALLAFIVGGGMTI